VTRSSTEYCIVDYLKQNAHSKIIGKKMSEEQIKGENGMLYDVTEVMDDNTNVVIIKKDGAIVEEQISKRGKV
jgi:hypothetical protein